MFRHSTLAAAHLAVAALIGCLLACPTSSQTVTAARLQVAFVADKDDAFAAELRTALKQAGMRIRLVAPKECCRESWWQADVVVLAWPADLPVASRTPLERWDRPTVFVGDTGDRFAKMWDLPTARQVNERLLHAGRELEVREFAGGDGQCVRQGNLVHLPMPLPTQRAVWFAECEATVRWAAHFRSDRPMLRIVRDKQRIEAERQRVSRVHAATVALDVEANVLKSLLDLPNMLLGSDQEQAEALLVDLFPEGPGAGATRNDWMNWLRARGPALFWDPATELWHLDKLAYWRGHRGPRRIEQRAEGLDNDTRAIPLARKVVNYYGGQALDDLSTFSCWSGDVHYMWDRRRGYFRIENHEERDAATARRPWRVTALDTATNEQLDWDRTRHTAAATSFRSLIELTFLPLMLLDPGTELRYLEAQSDEQTAALAVRLAGRNMNLTSNYRLTIDRATGSVLRLSSAMQGVTYQEHSLKSTITCGPLRLPAVWESGLAPAIRTLAIEDAAWNPALPEGLETAAELLSAPRQK